MLYLKMFFAAVSALFMSIAGIFSPAFKTNVCMIAHRGYSGRYHENTELAFEKAFEHGSGGCETDVRISKDGVLVLSHNSAIVLNDGTELEVSNHTYAELSAKPLKNKHGRETVYICTFEKYLEIAKEHNGICFIELKGSWPDEKINECFTMCREKYDISKCILQSFDFDNLLNARKLFPDLPIMLTYGTDDEGWERCIENGFSIDANFAAITEEMVSAFHDAGLEVGAWTCNEFFSLSYAKSLGVDYIESDVFGG